MASGKIGRITAGAGACLVLLTAAAALAQDAAAPADGSASPAVIAPVTKPVAAPKIEIKNAAPTTATAAPKAKATPPADPAVKAVTAEKKPGTNSGANEVLPWTASPAATGATAPAAKAATPPATSAAPATPAVAAAPSQCKGLFEAACRDNTQCAWIADIKLTEGSIAAHCMERPRPPAKTETKPAAKPAKAAAVKPKEKPAAPAVAVPKTEGTLAVPASKNTAAPAAVPAAQ